MAKRIPKTHQIERPDIGTVILFPDNEAFANDGAEDVEPIADAWQKYATKGFKNMIVAEEESENAGT